MAAAEDLGAGLRPREAADVMYVVANLHRLRHAVPRKVFVRIVRFAKRLCDEDVISYDVALSCGRALHHYSISSPGQPNWCRYSARVRLRR